LTQGLRHSETVLIASESKTKLQNKLLNPCCLKADTHAHTHAHLLGVAQLMLITHSTPQLANVDSLLTMIPNLPIAGLHQNVYILI